MGDRAAAIDEHPDLASGLPRELAELACEFVGDQPFRRKATLSQAFELAGLAGLQAVRVAGDVDLGPRSRAAARAIPNLAAIPHLERGPAACWR
jgi:hypothetical protein